MRTDELAAAGILSVYLDGKPEQRDIESAADATHDFDLVLRSGVRIALEVTTAADQAIVSQDAAAFGKSWTSPSLAQDWWVVLSRRIVKPEARITRLMREVVTLLEAMERHEVTEVNRDWLQTVRDAIPSALISAREQLVMLGLNLARSNGPRQSSSGGQVDLSFSHGFGSDPGLANRLVVAAAASNVAKLRAADADERHLFVWMDLSHSGAEAAVSLGRRLQPGGHPAGHRCRVDRNPRRAAFRRRCFR